MIETENDTNGSSVIYSSDLINPTMQFEGMFVGLLVTYIFGTTYVYQYIKLCLEYRRGLLSDPEIKVGSILERTFNIKRLIPNFVKPCILKVQFVQVHTN